MKVEVWSEIICPWCGLGSHRLDRAVERFEHSDQVKVVHRSFPLSSGFPEDRTLSVREAFMAKYGAIPEQTGALDIEGMAAAEGLAPYRVLGNRVGNTDLAHEFLAHASALGKNREGWDTLFRAYFGTAEPIFALDDLLGFSDKLGLEREQTREVLTERRYRQQVQDDARGAQSLGAAGVPFILIDGRYTVPGAQSSDALLGLLRTAWNEAHPVTAVVPSGDAPTCGPDDCAVSPRP
ncbi:DsbA family oxidoreductase [Mycobacterium sp. 050134]|uniref:DsbA family oxidoreductase n=1 Tax=Mycobacterium sp. 050134 TaxID=3096111 RepID=UPI002ED7A60A